MKSAPLTHSNAIADAIRRTRRRAIVQIVAEQLGWGATAALLGLAVLLVAGAQIVGWFWPLLLLIVVAAVAIWRGRTRIPADYRVAQMIDQRLGLGDLLSTAWHFRNAGSEYAALVESRAEDAARTVNPHAAVPWRWTRGAVAALAALTLSGGLFMLRYGVLRSFDLRAPLAKISFDTLTGAPRPTQPGGPRQAALRLPFDEGFAVQDPDGARVEERDGAMQESLRTADVQDANQAARQGTGQDGHQGESQDGDSEEGERASAGKNQTPSGAGDAQRGEAGREQQRTPPQKDNSLMEKMRDALANLMDKLKTNPQGGENRQTASNKQGTGQTQKGERGKPQPGQRGQQQENGEGQSTDRAAESDGAQQQARSGQAGSNPDQAPNQDKSGVGRADGKKDIELAQQQQAMGKLSELLGKRALDVRGEVMVEVTNSRNQQLKTPYVNRTARHMEAGSDLNRDEVPLHLQEYVQRYYEKVRP